MRSLQANTRIIALVTNQGECSFNTRDIQYIVDHVSVQLQFINHQQKKYEIGVAESSMLVSML